MKIFVYILFFHLNTLGGIFSQSVLQLNEFYRPHTHDSLIIVFRWFFKVHCLCTIICREISYSSFCLLASNHFLPFCGQQRKTATWLHSTTWLNIIKLSIDNKPLSIKLSWMIYLFTSSDSILIWLKGLKKLLRINCLYTYVQRFDQQQNTLHFNDFQQILVLFFAIQTTATWNDWRFLVSMFYGEWNGNYGKENDGRIKP